MHNYHKSCIIIMHISCSLVYISNSPVMLLSFRTLKSKRGIRDRWSEGGFHTNYHLNRFFFSTNVGCVALAQCFESCTF